MKYTLGIIGFVIGFGMIQVPLTHAATATTTCDLTGTTVVYVNGIFTTKDEADAELELLQTKYQKHFKTNIPNFITGYNPSHLAGLGDLIKSAEQAYRTEQAPLNDYDLTDILTTIHTNVHTQKILLIGHSQGTYYTNAIYEYLIKNGIPPSAITLYNLATPASFVAGGGDYLTSTTDSVINAVRHANRLGNAPLPLTANTTFTLTEDEQHTPWPGHAFSPIYLKYADFTIARTIHDTLTTLRTTPVPHAVSSGCFTPPQNTLTHRTEHLAFTVFDPITRTLKNTPHALKIALNTIGRAERAGNQLISSAILTRLTRHTTPVVTRTASAPPQAPRFTAPPLPLHFRIVPRVLTPSPPTTQQLNQISTALNQASALLALLQTQVTQHNTQQEATCRAHSIRGPWDHVGWVGDTPGCNDPTPGVQKMFFAPIQGAGGEVVLATAGVAPPPVVVICDVTAPLVAGSAPCTLPPPPGAMS